jgi:hypothetical protein
MNVFRFSELVPEGYCRLVNNTYLRIKQLQEEGVSVDADQHVAFFQPAVLEKSPYPVYIAGQPTQNTVYATLLDAFVANRDIFLSPEFVFRGHHDSIWGLVPTRQRFSTERAREFYDGCRRRFVDAVQSIVGHGFPELALEALCQHYRIFTDLLDLTESFEVAAYFAQKGDREGVGCIWGFNREALGDLFVHYSAMPRMREFNQRIVRQRGCFLRVRDDEDLVCALDSAFVILFNQAVQVRPVLRLDGKNVADTMLFPPDEDDEIAGLASRILDEKRARDPVIRNLEQCSARFPSAKRRTAQEVCSVLLKEPTLFAERLRTPEFGIFPLSRLILEELVWHDRLDLLDTYLSAGEVFQHSVADPFDNPWHDLVTDYLLEKARDLGRLSSRESEAYWRLVMRFSGSIWNEFREALIQRFAHEESGLYADQFADRRGELLSAFEEATESFGVDVPDELESLKAMTTWYWHERGSANRERLKTLLDRQYEQWIPAAESMKREWPPRTPHLPMIGPHWVFQSNVMVWDIDACEKTQRVAAASSDCNVYLLDYEGIRRARCEMPTEVTQVRFLQDDILLANGRDGAIYWLRHSCSGGAEHLKIECEYTLHRIRDDRYGCLTTFSVDGDSGLVLAGYGNPYQRAGGIAFLTPSAQPMWAHRLDGAVLGALLRPGTANRADDEWVGMVTTVDSDQGTFAAHIVRKDGAAEQRLEGTLISPLGLSPAGTEFLLGSQTGGGSFQLIAYSAEDDTPGIVIETAGLPVAACYIAERACWVAASSPVRDSSDEPDCNVAAWDRSGRLLWKRDLTGHTLHLAVDVSRELLFVTSRGQGKVYALTFEGNLRCCANVEMAALCLKIIAGPGLLVVGSKSVSAFPLDAFVA